MIRIPQDVNDDIALLVLGLIEVVEADSSIHQLNLGPKVCADLRAIGRKLEAAQK